MTFCLSVENMVTLDPCFCFFMKALFFLTTFQTSSEDIYQLISTFPQEAIISLFFYNNQQKSLSYQTTYFNITITKESTEIEMNGGKNWVIW